MVTISDLYVYPVKSVGGVRLGSSAIGKRGLHRDRRWMIVDQDGLFMTQRSDTRLALFRTDISDDGLLLTNATGECRCVPYLPEGDARQVRVWRDTCDAVQVSAAIDEWLSDTLGQKCSLVYMPNESIRATNPEFTEPGDIVGFADAYPVLVIGAASLEELNSRLATPLPINRFRPNIVVSASTPYEEDTWARLQIGEVSMRAAKQCGRCSVTATDQDTGVVGVEPLRTLATYRLSGKTVQFGAYFVPVETGTIHVGDVVDVK